MKKNNLILVLGLLLFAGCSSESYQKAEGIIWNTSYHITYKGGAELKDSILPVLNEVGKSVSIFDSSSLVTKLNASDSVVADIHLVRVYDKSREINALSQGMFDPTVSPLVTAWGFGLGHKATPDTLAIDSIMKFIGIDKTSREGSVIYKSDPKIQFNFSALAKGYGVDAVAEMLRRNGVNDYMVEIGGEIDLSGESPSGKDWRIAIDAPVKDNLPGEMSACIISLTDVGIATSGNYRNYRKEGGGEVAHTISPVTGRPYISEILSATVIAKDCMEADALATACMASTPEEAKRILREVSAEGLLIFADSVWTTPGFQRFISTPADLSK